jgi:hypothetical protein
MTILAWNVTTVLIIAVNAVMRGGSHPEEMILIQAVLGSPPRVTLLDSPQIQARGSSDVSNTADPRNKVKRLVWPKRFHRFFLLVLRGSPWDRRMVSVTWFRHSKRMLSFPRRV